MSHLPDKTPLTEQQARSLAHWWGSEYRQMPSALGEKPLRHGVLVTRAGRGRLQPQAKCCYYIFSLEEAREMENRRGFQEAASPDWVG
jgi:hypothetical protein